MFPGVGEMTTTDYADSADGLNKKTKSMENEMKNGSQNSEVGGQVKERPILFSGPMVRAILDGSKTQTRRVVKRSLISQIDVERDGSFTLDSIIYDVMDGMTVRDVCPYGRVGDRLWVKETHALVEADDGGAEVIYRASCPQGPYGSYMVGDAEYHGKWKPSIFMRREFSRILRAVVDVRVERVQDISEEDARKEGVRRPFTQAECDEVAGLEESKPADHGYVNYLWHGRVGKGITAKQADSWPMQYSNYDTAKGSFSSLWESINGPRGFGWDSNPWVWVVEFRRVEGADKSDISDGSDGCCLGGGS